MDNFFAKKGIGLSKNNMAAIKPPRQHQLRSSESIPWVIHPQTPAIRPSTELPRGSATPHSWSNVAAQPLQAFHKNQSFMNLPPKCSKETVNMPFQRKDPPMMHARRSNDYSGENRSNSRERIQQDRKDKQTPTMSTEVFSSGFHSSKAHEIDPNIPKSDMKSMYDVLNNSYEQSQYRPSSMTHLQNEKNYQQLFSKPKEENSLEKKGPYQDNTMRQKGICIMKESQEKFRRQKDSQGKRQEVESRERSEERRKQVERQSSETREIRGTSTYWIEQKVKLRQEIEEKDKRILQLQKKLSDQQKEYKTKIMMLEYDIRGLKGTSNRLEIQYQNARKLLEVQRKSNEKAQQQMDKLMFFDDDLIHAKDYNRLKKQLEDVMTENAKMFQDHQKYILQVTEMRRNFTNKIEELQDELQKLKQESLRWKEKVENLGINCEDKRMLIKLQHQINFLLKKGEESRKNLLEKQENLEKAHIQIKQLTEKGNRNDQSRQNFFEGLNLQQLLESIARYENRLSDMNDMLQSKKLEIQKQKKTIQALSSQLRQAREDKKITSLKERSNQNILKNEVAALQQSLQSEIHLRSKKVAALQEKIERKVKELANKDNFIKDFLLNRVKEIDKSNVQELMGKINSFLVVEEPVEETTQSQVELQSEGTVDL